MPSPIYSLAAAGALVSTGPLLEVHTIVGLQITGTFVATIAFETSVDGVTWVARTMGPSDGTAAVTSTTAPGAWAAGMSGAQFRARCTAYTSGTVLVQYQLATTK